MERDLKKIQMHILDSQFFSLTTTISKQALEESRSGIAMLKMDL